MRLKSVLHTSLLLAMLGMVLSSCSGKSGDSDYSAASAAEAYYDLLTVGRYDAFVMGMAGADEMPAEYREHLAQLIQQQNETRWNKHGEWLSVEALESQESGDSAYVTLSIMFADSTSERVLLPMVRIDDEWLMQ